MRWLLRGIWEEVLEVLCVIALALGILVRSALALLAICGIWAVLRIGFHALVGR